MQIGPPEGFRPLRGTIAQLAGQNTVESRVGVLRRRTLRPDFLNCLLLLFIADFHQKFLYGLKPLMFLQRMVSGT
jgi:hypothetical protein